MQNRRSNGSNILPQDIEVHYAAGDRSSVHSQPGHNLNFTQQQINAALFNSNSPSYSVQPIIPIGSKHYQNQELHMAEILVESNGHQRSAFQFDTITPKKKNPIVKATPNNTDYNDAPLSSVMLDSGIELSQASTSNDNKENDEDDDDEIVTKEITEAATTNTACSNSSKTATSESSSDDNGGFVTPDDQEPKSHRVKRATVVGNPMFSASQDSESELAAPGESLGLDDLEMDYDQIMNYFDNLKVNKR